ncbi:MAG: hypothetical protein MUO64_03265 [Anaerolineales bacterium]|nr:hypothetical protein [Anaerolineales bacterium]
MKKGKSSLNAVLIRYATLRDNWRLFRLGIKVAAKVHPNLEQKPVVFFNATARLTGLSQNAAFAMLAAMGLQLDGVPVIYFACQAGMSRCVLGTNRDDHLQPPPCMGCITQAQRVFAHAPVVWFNYAPDPNLQAALESISIVQMSQFSYQLSAIGDQEIPIGSLVLPSLRWALRRYNLDDNEATRFLFREYILSAYRVAQEFIALLNQLEPQAAVIFNGIMFPEAVGRWVAIQLGYRVITHEVGFEPFSAFFTDGQATAYPIHIPHDFELSPEQSTRLDQYLEQRFQGNFSMAGIRFWPEMRGLNEAFLQRAAQYRQIVPVFTNVIYDTSQLHANTVFPHMFAWLDLILGIIKNHPETLFVIRAHPDEMRPGTRKQSRESVRGWVQAHKVADLPNVVFVDSQEYLSSYQLIQHSKFVMVYNSSIGLETVLLGVAVLCGGKARYTQYPTVFFPATVQEYAQEAEEFLLVEKTVIPEEFSRNARRFMYYQYYRASLPFGDFIENARRPGFVRLRSFRQDQLCSERCAAVHTILDGVIHNQPFLLPE